tara:strand:- start:2174 stop:3037 length:864 start_codon:yes stop_codon:yes gene_type:complete
MLIVPRLRQWLRNSIRQSRTRRRESRDAASSFIARHKLGYPERLEDRTLLTTFSVTSFNPSGPGTLLEAINSANNSPGLDVIEFDSSLAGRTFQFRDGTVDITDDLIINGLGADQTTILDDPNGKSRHFNITGADTEVTINDLRLTGGNGDTTSGLGGGSIYLAGRSLTVNRTLFDNNSTTRNGGAIFVSENSSLSIHSSTFANNSAEGTDPAGFGGAVDVSGTLYVTNSTFSGNRADESGGALSILGGTATIINSTITGNHSNDDGSGGSGTGGGIDTRLRSQRQR